MPETFISREDLDKEPVRFDEAVRAGPVLVTRDGRVSEVVLNAREYCRIKGDRYAEDAVPAHARMTISAAEYVELKRGFISLAYSLADRGGASLDFEPPRLDYTFKAPDLE